MINCVVLGMEPRDSLVLLGKHSTTERQPQLLSSVFSCKEVTKLLDKSCWIYSLPFYQEAWGLS